MEVFEQKGIPVTVCFVLPGLHDETVSKKYDNIRFRYMWKGFPHKNKISKALIFLWSLYKIRKIIRHGDIVYTYNINAIIKYLIGKKNIYYFAERTEHLDVTAKEPWPLGLSRKKCIETCKRLDGLFVISSQLKKYFVDNGLDAWKVHVINMTVDSNRFSNIEKNKTTERYIAYCGTASNNKDGVDELIKAFSIVANSIDDIKLYIIGKIPTKEDKVNNLALIENLNLKEKIVLTGVVSSNKMPQMLKNAEALVLDRPNSLQAQYGFPTKLGEYLLTGNPVVVTKVGDIPLYP